MRLKILSRNKARYTYVKVLILLICILFMLNTRGMAYSRVVFVSSTLGNDSNTGQDVVNPVRTIANALTKGDSILLRRGDCFYETVRLKNAYLSSYGVGDLPVISGYKKIIHPIWKQVAPNVWSISMVEDAYVGSCSFSQSSYLNNVGNIHDIEKDCIHGRKVQKMDHLREDWDFWQTEHFKSKETFPSDFDFLYLRLSKNPNDLHLEFSTGTSGVSIVNATIDGVRIEGFGKHGIASGTNTIIRNCVIDGIGGMTQVGYEKFTSLGNGIEFYVSSNISDCTVEKCRISRCYDCGVTIQASGCGQAAPKNIVVKQNCIADCCQGWEDFLRNDDNIVYTGCVFENNTVINSGKTSGFNYPPRFKYCHILGNNYKGNKGMIIRNNTFVGGNFYCSGEYKGKYQSNVWQGNRCYIVRGDFILSNYGGTKDVIRIPNDAKGYTSLGKATAAAIKRYRKLTGDETTRFIIMSDKRIQRKISKIRKNNQ